MLTLRKRGKFWHARGSVPMRQADGKIARVRIEESTRETSKARARRFASDLAEEYHNQAYRPKQKSISFTDAALTYVESNRPTKRDKQFAAKLNEFFGETPIADIDQAAISEAAHTLYPHASASTHVRAVFAPACTILRLSGVRPDWKRPRLNKPPITVPPDGWFDRVLPCCEPRLAALLIFVTLTGRRISEALKAIDNGDGTVSIGRTKTGSPVLVALPDLCRDYLGSVSAGKRLWTYGDRHNVYRELRKACEAAGVLVRDKQGKIVGGWYGTHAIGRHAFATRLLKAGRSVKHVAAAGGWKSPKMVLERYGHLEASEVAEDVKRLGQQWGKKRKMPAKTKDKKP